MSKSSGKRRKKTGHEARPVPRKVAEAAALVPEPEKRPPFDRVAYQRLYCRLWKKYGVMENWPSNALDELRSAFPKGGE